MNDLSTLQSMGFTMPTPAYLAGVMLFSILGFAAWRFGRKTSRTAAKWIGVALMFYPYAVTDTRLLYGVGIGLCAALYVFRGQ